MKPENSSNSSASSGNTIEDARVIEGVTASKKKKTSKSFEGLVLYSSQLYRKRHRDNQQFR